MPVVVLTERWMLTAEFDSIAETAAVGLYEGGLSEAAEFYQYCCKTAVDEWGFLDEEVGEGVAIDGEIVTVSLNIIDPFDDVFRWLLSYTTPKSVTLRRTESRI